MRKEFTVQSGMFIVGEEPRRQSRSSLPEYYGTFYLPRISDVRGNCLATRWNTPLFLGSRNPFSVELTGDRAKVTSQPRSETRSEF